MKLTYATVRRSAATYLLHGRTISEPYDYLEDPAGEETKAFVTSQCSLFEQFMEGSRQLRDTLFEKISRLQNYPRTSTVRQRLNGMNYFYHNTGLQNHSVLMRSASLEEGAPCEVFFDPNVLSADGTTALKTAAWNDSETLWAYSTSERGSDWQKIFVRSEADRKDLEGEVIDWVKFSGISWYKDDGFFYTRYPELKEGADKGAETDTAQNSSVYYHKIGTPQTADIKIVDRPDFPKWSIGAEVTDCQKYLIVTFHDGCEPDNLVWVAPLHGSPTGGCPLEFKRVIDAWDGEFSCIGNDGDSFYFISSRGSPNKKIISLNIATGEETLLVAERDSVLNYAALVGDTLLLVYLEHVKDTLYYRTLSDPSERRVEIPIGSIESLACDRRKSKMVSFKITSFLLPGRTYIFDIQDPEGTLRVFRTDHLDGFDPDQFVTKQHFFDSPDGTKIPMFVLHRSGLELTGKNPLLLYGYGGFNISLTPSFSPSRLVFLGDFNGVVAIPNIRGGGEYGQKWHDAGRRANKQNCFTDFIAAAKFLHAGGYGSPSSTCIMGGSNGGLLVAAVANQAPELLRAVVCQVGVLDMFKFHKFTIGHAWKSDYGNPDEEGDFKVLEGYSPLHNIKEGVSYPAILVVTGDHDDRVVPLHSLKYVAELQHKNPTFGGPFLARIEVSAGHGAGKPTSKRIEEAADTYAFIVKTVCSA
jgi:prolyl oligopeptidase